MFLLLSLNWMKFTRGLLERLTLRGAILNYCARLQWQKLNLVAQCHRILYVTCMVSKVGWRVFLCST
uniref:Uncharacterized protein n=1 Tax=Arundo donax TaxID=35708 RepID=A0A0A9E6F2_ARUDO